MIRYTVTVEMVPGGIESLARHMATIEIHNDVTETLRSGGRRGDYVAKFSRISQRGQHLGDYDRRVLVRGINRNRSGAVYRILYEALKTWFDDV